MTLANMLTRIDTMLGMTASSYTQAQRIEDINEAYNVLVAKVKNEVDGTYWDDINHSGIAIDKFDVVSGTREYKIATDDESVVITEIHSVGIKKDGDFIKLERTDLRDERFLQEEATGTPSCYAHNGNYIIFDITPDYGETGGLKITYSRAGKEFTSGDTSMEPGFFPEFHHLLPRYAAASYAGRKNLDTYNFHMSRFNDGVRDLIEKMSFVHDDRDTQLKAEYQEFI